MGGKDTLHGDIYGSYYCVATINYRANGVFVML